MFTIWITPIAGLSHLHWPDMHQVFFDLHLVGYHLKNRPTYHLFKQGKFTTYTFK